MAKSRIWGTEIPEPIATKFCMSSAVHHVITHANFWEDRLRGFSVAKGRILAFSIDLLHRLNNLEGAHLSLLRQRHNMNGNDSTVQSETKHTPT